jgi:hypothetical protein
MTRHDRAPHFPYVPMKVSFRKKVQLREFTPKQNQDRNLIKETLKAIGIGAFIGLVIACAVVMLVLGKGNED